MADFLVPEACVKIIIVTVCGDSLYLLFSLTHLFSVRFNAYVFELALRDAALIKSHISKFKALHVTHINTTPSAFKDKPFGRRSMYSCEYIVSCIWDLEFSYVPLFISITVHRQDLCSC